MTKHKFEIENVFCIEDINNVPTLFEMFAQTAELEGENRKSKKYRITIEEI